MQRRTGDLGRDRRIDRRPQLAEHIHTGDPLPNVVVELQDGASGNPDRSKRHGGDQGHPDRRITYHTCHARPCEATRGG